jgi:hypothetical protein
MLAADAVIAELKKQSEPVTTPEEIAQVARFLQMETKKLATSFIFLIFSLFLNQHALRI